MKYSQSQLILDSLRAPVESYMLADAVTIYDNEMVLDIGCGSGILTLSLIVKYPNTTHVFGIELVREHLSIAQSKQKELSQLKKNIAPCEWVCGDMRRIPFPKKTFDVIVSNPPFYSSYHGKGSPDQAKTLAHMDGTLSPNELLKSVGYCLQSHGRFYMVYPLSRMDEIQQSCVEYGFSIVKQMDYLDVRKRSGGITILTIQWQSESN